MIRPWPILPTLRPLLTLIGLAVLVAAACGGGGGGGGGTPSSPPTSQPAITFSPSNAAAPAVRLARGAGSTGSVLELQVRADGLSGVYGAAFDLTFPGGLLDYEGFTEGSFLGGGNGGGTSIQVAQTAAGRLVVGASRLGDVGGVDGSGVFVTLRFRAASAGSGSFGFTANRLLDSEGREISGTSWAGGTVDVTL